AYQLARNSFKEDAVNRVILATDGDFNVGIASREELKGFVERQRDEGIFLTVLGFGQGNYHDQLMQELAQNGNGIAAYIDTLGEAQKVLADQASAMLFPIASDVKIQVEFNPAKVREYRLIGYETRALNRADFNNDKVDAGDIGAGHRVTAIYEITPTGANSGLIDSSRYQQSAQSVGDYADEYGLLKLRYKLPGESRSKLIEIPVVDAATSGVLRQELRFSLAVAGFGELLRGGENAGDWDFETVLSWASESKGRDAYGYRSEFVQLVRKAQLAQAMR
ncbi:MAG: YfbK domain-containing protein, partial [Pseudomonadales bacterium]